MAGSIKKWILGLLGFIPELAKGVANYSFKASGGTATTATVDVVAGTGDHDQNIASAAADFFKSLQLYFLPTTTTAALRGKSYDISGFAVAGGVATFTTPSSMAASPVAGDLFYVVGALKGSSVSMEPKTENLTREAFERQTYEPPSSLKGLQSVSGNFQFELGGLTSENGDGDTPEEDRLAKFLEVVGQRRSVAGALVSGDWAAPDQGDVDDASIYEVGDPIMVGGHGSIIKSITIGATHTIQVKPPFPTNPTDGTEVFGGERWTPQDGGQRSMTLLLLRDDQLVVAKGCVFNVTVSSSFGKLVAATAEFDGEAWEPSDGATLKASQTAKKTVKHVAGRSYFENTRIALNAMEFNFNHERKEMRDDEEGTSWDILGRAATAKVVFRNKDKVPKATWEAQGTQGQLFVQIGNAPKAAIGIVGNAQIQDSIQSTNVEERVYWDATFGFVCDQEDADNPDKPELIRW